MKIEDQFLNSRGKWKTNFKTEEQYQEQMSRVKQIIRETNTDRDFDILDDYLQLLKHEYSNFLLEKEMREWKG